MELSGIDQYIVPIILIVGIIAGFYMTQWINWFTWGENKQREEALRERMKKREADRKKKKDKRKNG